MTAWVRLMETGIEEVDALHRDLLERMEELGSAMRRGRGRQSASLFLGYLERQMPGHFAFEEGLMLLDGYPRLQAHRNAHRAFAAELAKWLRDQEAGNSDDVIGLHGYVSHWFAAHEIPADALLGDYVRACRAGAGPPTTHFCLWPKIHLLEGSDDSQSTA